MTTKAARLLSRLWYLAKTLALRARFLTGKASFVEADVRMTTNSLVNAAQPRLLAHFQLETGRPRGGATGWKLYDEKVGPHPRRRTVVLACAYCGHRFVLQMQPPAEALAGAAPASYSSDWFRFMHVSLEGPADLFCAHCEQQGEPAKVEFLEAA